MKAIFYILFFLPTIVFCQSYNLKIDKSGSSRTEYKMIYDKTGKYIRTDNIVIVDSVYSFQTYLYPVKGSKVNPSRDTYLSITVNRSSLLGYSVNLEGTFEGIKTDKNYEFDSIFIVFNNKEMTKLCNGVGGKNYSQSSSVGRFNPPSAAYNISATLKLEEKDIEKLKLFNGVKVIINSSKYSNSGSFSGEIPIELNSSEMLNEYTFKLIEESSHFKPLPNPKNTSIKTQNDKIKIGDHKFGGIVFRVDNSGLHGLVISDSEVGEPVIYNDAIKIADTISINGFKKWRIPTREDWQTAQMKDMHLPTIWDLHNNHLIEFKEQYYWAKPASFDTGEIAYYAEGKDVVQWTGSLHRNSTKLSLRLIRNF